jgi:hypothetical protein
VDAVEILETPEIIRIAGIDVTQIEGMYKGFILASRCDISGQLHLFPVSLIVGVRAA